MKICVPDFALVVLAGPSGSGKSTFAHRHFKATEVISSDRCRGLVADDENDQSATADAFDVVRYLAGKRLAARRLTVIDATSVRPADRRPLIELARRFHAPPVAIVLDLPPELCHQRGQARPERNYAYEVAERQSRLLRQSLDGLSREGFQRVTVLSSPGAVDAVCIERRPLRADRRDDRGPFDIIGGVHGCFDELVELLVELGYTVVAQPDAPAAWHTGGRRAVFLGGLVDRGPDGPAVLRLVMSMVEQGSALCVLGRDEAKLRKALRGRRVRLSRVLSATVGRIANEPAERRERIRSFLGDLPSHYVLATGHLVVAHAGLREELQGRDSRRVRTFAVYGEATRDPGASDSPLDDGWTSAYRGGAMVVYGDAPVAEVEWVNSTLCVDTGCVFGGGLTALRYPERQLVQVSAKKAYRKPRRLRAPAEDGQLPLVEGSYRYPLDIDDVLGKRFIRTRFQLNVVIREDSAAAALEAMGRKAVDPRWLIYAPPTSASSDPCMEGDLLEHPSGAFAWFRKHGVSTVLCQETHPGPTMVAVLCRDEAAARRRFGIRGSLGTAYTRAGAPLSLVNLPSAQVVTRLQAAASRAGLWKRFNADWICIEGQVVPQRSAAPEPGSGQDTRESSVSTCQQIAPLHLLASEQGVYTGRDRNWHGEVMADLRAADGALLCPVRTLEVNVGDPQSEAQGVTWWEASVAQGVAGAVIRPLDWLSPGGQGLIQPALECRGREARRPTHGLECTPPGSPAGLRERDASADRQLALHQLALGLEALHRFVDGEPLYRVHECTFGALALACEPVQADPSR